MNGHVDAKRLMLALRTLKKGDFTVRLPADETVLGAAIADAFNEVAELLENSTLEFERIGKVVGKEGRISQRATLGATTGSWANWVGSVNTLIGDLVQPTEEVARVIGAVAKGDLSQRISLENEGSPLKGEFLRIGKTVNTMVDQLGSFASEVTRVAREVGSEGKLGGQAVVRDVAGTWKDLT
ncbi:HAMP domain-containing protein, partial [Singulisphaera rosea]